MPQGADEFFRNLNQLDRLTPTAGSALTPTGGTAIVPSGPSPNGGPAGVRRGGRHPLDRPASQPFFQQGGLTPFQQASIQINAEKRRLDELNSTLQAMSSMAKLREDQNRALAAGPALQDLIDIDPRSPDYREEILRFRDRHRLAEGVKFVEDAIANKEKDHVRHLRLQDEAATFRRGVEEKSRTADAARARAAEKEFVTSSISTTGTETFVAPETPSTPDPASELKDILFSRDLRAGDIRALSESAKEQEGDEITIEIARSKEGEAITRTVPRDEIERMAKLQRTIASGSDDPSPLRTPSEQTNPIRESESRVRELFEQKRKARQQR